MFRLYEPTSPHFKKEYHVVEVLENFLNLENGSRKSPESRYELFNRHGIKF